MLNFVNIENELSFQDRFSIPDSGFSTQIALKNKPLDFQYESSESVSSFEAVKLDAFGQYLESISLSTSLVVLSNGYHICDGLTDYSSDLECGNYYFIVNSKYKSETFRVITDIVQGSLGKNSIYVSGLHFFDNTIDIEFRNKPGKPYLYLGVEYSENSNILPFRYLSSESISTFQLIELNTLGQAINTTTLSTSLVNSDGTYHYNNDSEYNFRCGTYYFLINGKYESEIFEVTELENVPDGIGYDIIEITLEVY
jgi:hypothetical protein